MHVKLLMIINDDVGGVLAADGDSPVQKTTQNGHHHQVEVKEIFFA